MLELRSRTDSLAMLQLKMQEYAGNGVLLGVLINPIDRQVEWYRAEGTIEILEHAGAIDCTEVLPGFVINLQQIL